MMKPARPTRHRNPSDESPAHRKPLNIRLCQPDTLQEGQRIHHRFVRKITEIDNLPGNQVT
jgi:hypothetical protein